MNSINFRKLGIFWVAVEIILVAYVLLFTYAVFMRTITFGFQEIIIKKAYPFFIMANIFMILCCIVMLYLLLKKDRKAFIAQGLWFVPAIFTVLKITYNQGQTEILFQKYLFYVAAGPSVYIPLKMNPIILQINVLGIIALLLISAIYRKTKRV